ncbi:MAG: peroxiredoxin [Pseudomonadota bacterium]
MPLFRIAPTPILYLLLLGLLAGGAAAQPAEGGPAPDFELADQNGRLHALEDYRERWVVLYFYPRSGTPACTVEACEFRDSIDEFRELNAQVLGVSLDPADLQQAFAEQLGLPFPLLSDTDGAVARVYGVRTHKLGATVARRQTFLISPEGTLVKHYADVQVEGHSGQVLADLRALIRAGTDAPASERDS